MVLEALLRLMISSPAPRHHGLLVPLMVTTAKSLPKFFVLEPVPAAAGLAHARSCLQGCTQNAVVVPCPRSCLL